MAKRSNSEPTTRAEVINELMDTALYRAKYEFNVDPVDDDTFRWLYLQLTGKEMGDG